MEEKEVYQLSRKALEYIVGAIAEKIFGVELEQTSDAEDKAYKVDLKNKDLSFNIQVKTKQSETNHYYYKSNKELENNVYFAFFKASFNKDIIDSLGLLYNKNAVKQYILDNPTIYFVDTNYIKLLENNNDVEYKKQYNEYWIKDFNNIEHYYDTEYYKTTNEPYVTEYKITNEDLDILDLIYTHMR